MSHRCAVCARAFAALLVVDVRQGAGTRVERWCSACVADCRRFALRTRTLPATSHDGDANG
jgi:hypothetical protein